MEIHFNSEHSNMLLAEKLETCATKYGDTVLPDSQNMAWKGFYDYWNTRGTDRDSMGMDDKWGTCDKHSADWQHRCRVHVPYVEHTPETFHDNVLIQEPCNFASNVAYLRAGNSICHYPEWSISEQQQTTAKRAFYLLGFGSAFWHGSYTFVGWKLDGQGISQFTYVVYQILA